jgi:hypothetical protein
MYATDPTVVQGLSLNIKRTLLKIDISTQGYIATDPSALAALRRLLQPVDLLRTLLDPMKSLMWTAWLYVIIIPRQDEAGIQRPVIEPMYAMCSGNVCSARYHLYTQPTMVLNFDMPPLPAFHRRMFCDLITNQQVQQVLGPLSR